MGVIFLNLKAFYKYLLISFGGLLYAIGINAFLVPSKIVMGGLGGIATILFHSIGVIPTIVITVGNLILLVIAFLLLGKTFVLDSLFGIFISTFFVSVTEFLPSITQEPLLSSIFGGIIMGSGVGLTFIHNGTTGGTDIVSRIIQHYFPHHSIGSVMTFIDLIIIAVSFLVFKNPELIMYGIISLFIANSVIDGMISHLNSGVLVFIITPNSKKVIKDILNTLGRGVTIIEGQGGFSNEEKHILMCVMKKYDLESLKKFIDNENAFMIVTSSKEVIGEGFRYYR